MSARPAPAMSQCAIRKTCIPRSNVSRQQRPIRAVPGRRQGLAQVCRAAAEKESTTNEDALKVPDVPPAKNNSPEQIPPATEDPATSGSDDVEQPARMSAEEIGAQMSQLREASKGQQKKDGMIDGVLEEVKLISWPTPQSALLNTVLVITIVAGTSAVLFGVNTLLAEASRVVYSL